MKKLLLLSLFALSSPILFADIEDDEFVMIEDGQLEDEFTEVGTTILSEDTAKASELIDWNVELVNQSGNSVDVKVYKIEGSSEGFYRKLMTYHHVKHSRYTVGSPITQTRIDAKKMVRFELKPDLYVVCLKKSTSNEFEKYYEIPLSKNNTGYFVISPKLELLAVPRTDRTTDSGLPTIKNIPQSGITNIRSASYIEF